jgi:hypothetical protein
VLKVQNSSYFEGEKKRKKRRKKKKLCFVTKEGHNDDYGETKLARLQTKF